MEQEYIESLSDEERMVIKIAEEILKSSFDISSSIGFLEWLKNK
jgi:hypothetical protein